MPLVSIASRQVMALAASAVLSVGSALTAQAQSSGPTAAYGRPYDASGYTSRRALDGTPRQPRGPYDPDYRGPRNVSPRPYDRDAGTHPGIWQGLYAGIHGGYVHGWAAPAGYGDSVGLSGGTLGLHLGYNWQHGPWVVGLEADASWMPIDGARSFAGPVWLEAESDWSSTMRMRLGYSFGGVLLYATGGVALANFAISRADALGLVRVDETEVGYAVGGGVEVEIAPGIRGRLEAIHMGFGETKLDHGSGRLPIDLDVTTVRAGVTFKLN